MLKNQYNMNKKIQTKKLKNKKGAAAIITILIIMSISASISYVVFGGVGEKSKVAGNKISNIIHGNEDIQPGNGGIGDETFIPEVPITEEVVVPEIPENVDPSLEGYTFNIYTKTIIRYSGINKNIIIPKSFLINGISYDVLNIETRAFENSGLTSLVIPNQIQNIGAEAFKGNTFTGKVIIDATPISTSKAFNGAVIGDNLALSTNVTKIQPGMFYNAGITRLVIPDTVTSLGSESFKINKLTEITIPSSVLTFGPNIFEMNLISEFIIPEQMVDIPNGLLRRNQLRKLIIPEHVKTIGNYAFAENPLDIEVLLNTNLDTTSTVTKTSSPFMGGAIGDALTITDKVTTIPKYLFADAGITSFELPNSVTSVGIYAFTMNSLTEAPVTPNVTSWGSGVYSQNNVEYFTIPSNMTNVPASFLSYNNLKKLTIPSHVISLGAYAFHANNFTEGVVINSSLPGNSLTSSTQTGVSGSTISKLEFGPEVTSIPAGMFYAAKFSGGIELHSNIKTIGAYAFHNATGLTSVTFDNAYGDVIIKSSAFTSPYPQYIYLK